MPVDRGLAHTAWRAVAFHQAGETLAVPPWETLSLRFGDGRVEGVADCNTFQGLYRQKGEHLTFRHLAGTKKGCGRKSHGELFLDALRRVNRFERRGHLLILHAPGMAIELEPVP